MKKKKKKSNKHKYPFCILKWIDHCGGDNSWTSLSDVTDAKPVVIVSAGWVVKETSTYLVILPHGGIDVSTSEIAHNCRGHICIIKNCIIERETLPKFALS